MNLHCTVLTYCTWSRWTLALHFLRHLCKCWYNVLLNSNELWGCKNPIVAVEHNPIMLTKFTCHCVHATFFVPCYTKRTKESTEARLTASALYEVWLKRVVLARCAAGNTYKYITLPWCNGDKRKCERMSHPSAHGGSCALSEVLTASGRHASLKDKRSAWLGSDIWLAKWS